MTVECRNCSTGAKNELLTKYERAADPRTAALRRRPMPADLKRLSKPKLHFPALRQSPALDAGLLGAAQAVEHYEISRYGTLIAWAEELGLDDAAVSLLEETLEEEQATDEALTEIAKTAINQQAQAA
jgi:uncharacterized protein DUF892